MTKQASKKTADLFIYHAGEAYPNLKPGDKVDIKTRGGVTVEGIPAALVPWIYDGDAVTPWDVIAYRRTPAEVRTQAGEPVPAKRGPKPGKKAPVLVDDPAESDAV